MFIGHYGPAIAIKAIRRNENRRFSESSDPSQGQKFPILQGTTRSFFVGRIANAAGARSVTQSLVPY